MPIEKSGNIQNNVPLTVFFGVGRPETRNAIFAPSKFNAYGGAAFPGITDLLHEIEDLASDEKTKRYKELKKHVSDLMIMIKEASRFLLSTELI